MVVWVEELLRKSEENTIQRGVLYTSETGDLGQVSPGNHVPRERHRKQVEQWPCVTGTSWKGMEQQSCGRSRERERSE